MRQRARMGVDVHEHGLVGAVIRLAGDGIHAVLHEVVRRDGNGDFG